MMDAEFQNSEVRRHLSLTIHHYTFDAEYVGA
jgi:hypothetical protein